MAEYWPHSFVHNLFMAIVFPKEIENNAYANFWRNNKEFLRKAYCMHRLYTLQHFQIKFKNIQLPYLFD